MEVNLSKIPTSEWHYKIIEEELRLKDEKRPMIKIRYEYLEDIINMHNYKNIVEVGAGTGIPALYILKNCPKLEEYIAIDPLWPISGSNQIPFPFDLFLSARPKNKFLKQFSLDAVKGIDNNSCDIIYLDHLAHLKKGEDLKYNVDLVKKELIAWLPKVKKGGIICGHDYCVPSHQAVVDALKEFFYPGGINLWMENHLYGGMTEMTDYFWWRYV